MHQILSLGLCLSLCVCTVCVSYVVFCLLPDCQASQPLTHSVPLWPHPSLPDSHTHTYPLSLSLHDFSLLHNFLSFLSLSSVLPIFYTPFSLPLFDHYIFSNLLLLFLAALSLLTYTVTPFCLINTQRSNTTSQACSFTRARLPSFYMHRPSPQLVLLQYKYAHNAMPAPTQNKCASVHGNSWSRWARNEPSPLARYNKCKYNKHNPRWTEEKI